MKRIFAVLILAFSILGTLKSAGQALFTAEPMLLKNRTEIKAAHTSSAYKLLVDQPYKEENYIVYGYYGQVRLAYYFEKACDDCCSIFEATLNNTTLQKVDLSYLNTHFRIVRKNYWIDESPMVQYINGLKFTWQTQWQAFEKKEKDGTPYVVFQAGPYSPEPKGKKEYLPNIKSIKTSNKKS